MTLKEWRPKRYTEYVRKRACKALTMKKRGYPISFIAGQMGVSRTQVYKWLYWLEATR